MTDELDLDIDEEIKKEDDIDDLFGTDLGFDSFGSEGVKTLEKHNDLLKGLTDFAPYLKDIFNTWLALKWDEKERKYIPDEDLDPIMNIKCAKRCINILKRYARDNNILTHIEEKAYNWIVADLIDEIWTNMMTRKEEFGIKNNGDVLMICNQIQHSAELALMGAGDGKYSDLLKTSVSRIENVSLNQEKETKGLKKDSGRMAGLRKFFGVV